MQAPRACSHSKEQEPGEIVCTYSSHLCLCFFCTLKGCLFLTLPGCNTFLYLPSALIYELVWKKTLRWVSPTMQSTKGDLPVGPTAKPLHPASLFLGVDSSECLVETSSPVRHSTQMGSSSPPATAQSCYNSNSYM